MPRIGDQLDLALRLWDRAEDKYVRARVYRPDETEVPGSPVAMTHMAGGTYVDSSLIWPNQPYLVFNYDVFMDAAFTTLSPNHLPQVERVYLDQGAQDIENLLTLITNVDLVARLEDDCMLRAQLMEEGELTAVLIQGAGVEEVINIIEGTRAIVTDGINGSGSFQPAFKAWAWADNNKVVLADADDFNLSDFAGVNPEDIGDLAQGQFIRAGRVVGALTGRGFIAGTTIYLGQNPGELTDIGPSGANVIIIGKAEPKNPTDTGEAQDLFVEPQIIG